MQEQGELPEDDAAPTLNEARLTKRVLSSQMLFTAGHALSTGGFLRYFISTFRPGAVEYALVEVTPDLCGAAGALLRPRVLRLANRKRVWMACLILARLVAVVIPVAAVTGFGAPFASPMTIILLGLAAWNLLQGTAYVAFVSWLSDLSPEQRWGRFFGARQLAQIAIQLTVATAAIAAAQWARTTLPPDDRTTFFTGAFRIGGLLAILSILPMLRVPAVPLHREGAPGSLRLAWRALAPGPLRQVVFNMWHLAAFQGLTQGVLTKYQIEELLIPFDHYLMMQGAMLVVQAALTPLAARWIERGHGVRALLWSELLVALAMVFPLLAMTHGYWLQLGAYLTWGLFGIVNLASETLLLQLAPRSDNTLQIGLFRQVSGLIAGMTGLFGGIVLDRLLADGWAVHLFGRLWDGYALLIVASFLGRLMAPVWLLRLARPRTG